jgi:tyrosine-protein kinase Etk/Wzc
MALDMEKRQQSERFTVVDRAEVPGQPIKPNKPLLYAGAGIVGLLLGMVMGFGAELRQNVVLGEWELPEGTPVLARLPYIEVRAMSEAAAPRPRGGWFRRKKPLIDATATARS